jgi:hypothetical protein
MQPLSLSRFRRQNASEDEPDINLAEWIDASAESEADGGEAATGMASQPAQQEKTPNEPNSQALTKGNNQTNYA